MDNKNIYIIILSAACLILIPLAYLGWHREVNNYDEVFIERRLDSLNNENEQLIKSADRNEKRSVIAEHYADSLSKLPPKIKTVYVTLYKEIDKASANDVVILSDSLFSGGYSDKE
jgi:hypothetical protein